MIHRYLSVSGIAFRYYRIVHPERKYTEESQQSLRQFRQDKKIDKKILKKVITDIFKEQKALLK